MTLDSVVNVLFVEDDELDVELAVRAMERDQLQVTSLRVDSERELVRALGERRPDVILSDFTMPQFDGIHALRIVQTSAPDVPFIFLSGTIGEERAIEAIRLGATDYVLKSNMRRLATAVRRALEEAAERRRTRAAEEERSRLIEILEATSDYVGMADPEGRLIYVNAAGRRMLGSSGDATGESRADWASDLPAGERLLAAVRDGAWQGETALKRSDGSEVPVSQVIIAHQAPDRSLRFFSTIARDVSERKAFERRIEYLANYDDLSGLPNRVLLADRATQAIAYARRKGRYCALLLTNFDRFKRVNESYGYNTGDLVVREFGERLRACVRDGDTVARLPSGFAILAADLARPDDVHIVARKTMEVAARPFQVGSAELKLTVSAGASIFPQDGEDFEALHRGAETARNGAKAAGGDRFQFYAAEMGREVAERLELESALRGAIEKGGLHLHFQPQVDLASGRIVGAEALARWHHAERGWISPAVFIPIAEESNLIDAIGRWALREAGQRVREWKSMRISVNVSARQFREEGLVDTVAETLRQNRIEPSSLELELTESVLVEDRNRVSAVLEALRGLGVRIAIDDFGTGYSNLSYLSSLPIDCLKIDGSFVRKIVAGGRDLAIVQAIISMARALGLRVVAEGVETKTQRDFLRRHGCDEAQGYVFSPAVAPETFAALCSGGVISASDHGSK
jgi:diguanylate cyclase (GGDEF)-like protein/PAS domain S-box-containing protein